MLTQVSGSRVCIGGSITQAWVTHMTGLRKQTQAFTVNCIVSIDYLVWPKAPVIQDVPRAQRLAPKSWSRMSLFSGMCRVGAPQAC